MSVARPLAPSRPCDVGGEKVRSLVQTAPLCTGVSPSGRTGNVPAVTALIAGTQTLKDLSSGIQGSNLGPSR